MPLNDPVAHLRDNLHGWISSAPEDEIRALMKVRRNLDSNLRKPSPPAGWRPLNDVATDSGLHIAHIARLCRDVYSAQGLARICTLRRRLTWCLAPAAASQICANRMPTDDVIRDRSTSPADHAAGASERQPSANREGFADPIAQNVRTSDQTLKTPLEPTSTPVPTALERTLSPGSNFQSTPDMPARSAQIFKLPASIPDRS